jgi:hypothetical protein
MQCTRPKNEARGWSVALKHSAAASSKIVWTGRAVSGLVTLLLLFDGSIKLMNLPFVVRDIVRLGYPPSLVVTIGILEFGCALLYAIPFTSIVGVILLTGFLGGAVATHARIGHPLFSHDLFPIYIGIMAWGGLRLRETRLHELIPLRK